MKLNNGFIIFCLSLFQVVNVYAQQGEYYERKGDSAGRLENYALAAEYFLAESRAYSMTSFKKNALMNAAYDFTRAGELSKAAHYLHQSVIAFGFRNMNFLMHDSTILKLQNEPLFKSSISFIKNEEEKKTQIANAIINTGDIVLFWKVYDEFLTDSINAAGLFIHDYFEKGSVALQEYYRLKTPNIGGITGFVNNLKHMPKFYAGIRNNTLMIPMIKDTFLNVYKELKVLFPAATFPNLNFHIGGWSSGGTATDYGIHIGADIYANDKSIDKSELSDWQKRNSYEFASLKFVVAHELVHAQQKNLRDDTTLLAAVLREGMADFIGELISGKTANENLHKWSKGKEAEVYSRFEKEMYLRRGRYWIANSSMETPEWPADLGYVVGYWICRAYYNQVKSPKKAVYDMLTIKNYKDFFEKSHLAQSVADGAYNNFVKSQQ